MPYLKDVDALTTLLKQNPTWSAIKPEHAARMRAQNKFQIGRASCRERVFDRV